MKSLGGSMILHNAVKFDYCVTESLHSLCGVCDEVVVLLAENEDETEGVARAVAEQHPGKVRFINDRWRPCQYGLWLSDLTNQARRTLNTEFHISLQADEVLHPEDYPLIRSACREDVTTRVHRLNFWVRPDRILEHGKVCGHRICRIAPSFVPSVLDAEFLDDNERSDEMSEIRFYHYGFLRRLDAMVKKIIPMQEAWIGTHDPMFDVIEKQGRQMMDGHNGNGSIPYHGPHPKIIAQWLHDRGYGSVPLT